MSPEVKKLAAIIIKLYKQTRAGEITWEEGFDKNPYHRLKNGKTITLSSFWYEDDPYEKIEIGNSETGGSVTFTDAHFPRNEPAFGEFESWYLAMKELREKAERQAAGTDGILDDVMDALQIDLTDAAVSIDDDIPF